MSTYDLIRNAILNKQNISATYSGHPRLMSPHAIGTKNGTPQCLCYQYGGSSSSGLAPAGSPNNWRCMPIGGLSNVSVVAGTWSTASNHSQAQTCVGEVDVEVDS
jgi:hypothetical protein